MVYLIKTLHFINFLLECPIFATNIVDVKSINLLPATSNIEKFSAFDQIIELTMH